MDRIQNNTTQLSKGLNKDFDPIKTDIEFLTFALNAINDSHSGSRGSIHSEPGNELCSEESRAINGYIYGNDEVFLFSSDVTTSEIGILRDCKYTKLMETDCLGFNSCNQIKGEFRIKNGCDRLLYWNDGVNPDRSINIDRLDDYKDEEGNWDCNLMRLNPTFKSPCINLLEVKEYGGKLEYGTYFVVVEYLDDNNNVLHRSNPSQPINITKGLNIEFYDPSIGGLPLSNKSICLRITDIDPSVTRLRFNVIRYISGDGITRTAVRFKTTVAASNQVDYIISRVTAEDELISVDELVVPNIVYDTSKYMEQAQGRLLRSNLKEKEYDFNSFQKFASKIGSNFEIKRISKTDTDTLNDWWDCRSFQGNEVYSPFIKYVMDDGTISPMFHIPGTPMDFNPITEDFLGPNGNTNQEHTEYYLRIDFGGAVLDIDLQEVTATINVKYTVNGSNEQFTFLHTFFGPFDKYQEFSAYKVTKRELSPLSNIIVTVDIPGFDKIDYSYTLESELIEEDNNSTQVYNSYDCSKSPIWLESMSHILSEKVYRDILGDLYGKYDETSIKLIQDLPVPCKWEYENTAFLTSLDSGRFGYYECQQGIYESTCEENYWGVDISGQSLVGNPIRHFRVPPRSLIPVDSIDNTVTKLGFNFTNIEYPEGVVGHYIAFAKRNDFNRSVLDTGIVGNMGFKDNNVAYGQWRMDNKDPEWKYYMSPKTLYSDQYLNVSNVYTNYSKVRTYNGEAIKDEDLGDGVGDGNAQEDYAIVNKTSWYESRQNVTQHNYVVEDNYKLDRGEFIEDGNRRVMNPSIANNIGAIKYNRDIPTNNIDYVNFEVYNPNINCNLDIVEGYISHPCMFTLENNSPVYGGDVYLSEFNLVNYIFLGVEEGGWKSYLKLLFTSITSGLYLLFGDDNIEDYQDLLDINRGNTKEKLFYADGIISTSSQSWYGIDVLRGIWIESEFNNRYRLEGLDACFKYFEGVTSPATDETTLQAEQQAAQDYLEVKIADITLEDPKGNLKANLCPENYLYNSDYNLLSCDKPCFTHVEDCSNCRNEYPNRTVYSQVSFDEELQDTYSITLANDYIDIPSHKGNITGIHFDKNKLYIHTENSTFIKQTNPQILQTNENNVFVGTGEFLALPEIEFNSIESGYAGMQSRFGSKETEFGYIWIDEKRGQIFIDKGNGISNLDISVGMSQWLKENLPSKLKKYADCYGHTVCDQIGVRLAYDPRFKRVIITKKDYLPPDTNTFNEKVVLTPEVLNRARNFIEDSWTISFSLLGNYYISWHSYIPDFYFNDATNYYSIIDNSVWKHLHKGNYQNYYDKKYDFITEFCIPNILTTDLHSIHYTGKPLLWNDLDNKWKEEVEETFDRVLVYNDCESTGIKRLKYLDQHDNPFGNLITDNRETNIIMTDDTYKVSNIYDIAVDSPVSTSNLLSVDYDNYRRLNGYIDCIPKNIDYNTTQFNLKLLNDKWFKVRLFSKSDKDVKQTIHYINVDNFISIR